MIEGDWIKQGTTVIDVGINRINAPESDIVIVGGRPAGLAAAIRLKQINPDLAVVVLKREQK
ncbi:hypothetical protein [Phyllobacterium zundukense]|uniref:hypothetical protein n=1 Tax=Phyllobacterium zundukense TaxID=1867719 RepID=UPI003965C10A